MKYSTLITFAIMLISFASIFDVAKLTVFPLGNTTFWWVIYLFYTVLIVRTRNKYTNFNTVKKNHLLPIYILLIWFGFAILRGIIIAENYWQWKNLIKVGFTLLIPFISFLTIYTSFFSFIIKKWVTYTLPFIVIIYFILNHDADGLGRFLAPISILTLFFPLVNNRYKAILLGLSLLVITDNLDARSNVIKFSIAILFGITLYTGLFKLKKLLNIVFITSMITPFILLILGITGIFNVFKFDEYMTIDENKSVVQSRSGRDVNLAIDTRTFIYEEVIYSAIKNEYIIFGRTPARGNDSISFGEENYKLGLDNIERFMNEVAVLNIFTWTGLIGLLLYFFVFYKGAYLSINKSKNIYAKYLGVYLCFRWIYGWVEDFTNIDISYILLWMIIGLCYSEQFRNMSNVEVELWAKKMIYIKFKKNN